MSKINNFYFAFDGVIIPLFSETIMHVLESEGNCSIDVSFQDIQRLTMDLYLGKIGAEAYFSEIAHLAGSKIAADKLASLAVDRIKAITGVEDVIGELAQTYSVCVYSQLPPDLYHQTVQKLGLDSLNEAKTIYSSQLSLTGWNEAVFRKMVLENRISANDCMWIDADPHMTSAAVRTGIHAIIFVDSRRLRREIALRGLLPLLGDE